MGRIVLIMVAGIMCFVLALSGGTAWAGGGPQYVSRAAEKIVTSMLDAHGGIDRWRASPTISFHSHLKLDVGGGNWVEFWEEVTVETKSRHVYADLPNADGTRGQLAFDGETAWSSGNLQGIAQAPARFTAWRNFYLFNIPFLTQDGGVIIGEPGRGKIPHADKEYITIQMSFQRSAGDTPGDRYILYIDPETYQLKASEYGMTYKSMLPEGVEETPRSFFVWEKTTTVDGLVVPAQYNVYWKSDGTKVVTGEVSNWSFKEPFDESRMDMPEGGKVDQSQP